MLTVHGRIICYVNSRRCCQDVTDAVERQLGRARSSQATDMGDRYKVVVVLDDKEVDDDFDPAEVIYEIWQELDEYCWACVSLNGDQRFDLTMTYDDYKEWKDE